MNAFATGSNINHMQELVADVAEANTVLALDALVELVGAGVQAGDLTALAPDVQNLAQEATRASEMMAVVAIPGSDVSELRLLGDAVRGMNASASQIAAELAARSEGPKAEAIQSLTERSAALRAEADRVLNGAPSS